MRAIRTPSEDNLRRPNQMEGQRQERSQQYQPMNQHSIDQRTHALLQAAGTVNPFHSPYIDPVGSIIGLRVLYIDGNMCYVPVEPHVNFMINQQFGRIGHEQTGEERLLPNGRSIIQELQSRQPVPVHENRSNYEEKRGVIQEGKATASSSGVSSLSGEQEMDDPPWARPHPQPANGKRGTAAWRNEPRKSSLNRQPPGGFTSDLFGTGLSSASTNQSNQSRRSQPVHSYEPPPPSNPLGDRARERSRNQQQPEEEYNPWGRGGGGAPLRDPQGNIVTDRRRFAASWSRSVDTNETHHLDKDRTGNYLLHSRPAFAYQVPFRRPSLDYHTTPSTHQFFLPPIYPPSASTHYHEYHDEYANRRGGGGSPMSHATSMPSLASKQNLSPADQHRAELEKQIEDNRRRKEAERLKEIEMEKKEIQRWEERNARIRAEEEEAKNKAREKALAMERRKEAIAAREEQRMRGRRTPPPQMMERRDDGGGNEGGERKLEWWEKKPTWQTQQLEREPSAVIPALRNNGRRTPSAPSRVPSAGGDRADSRQSYRPAESVRQHSARRNSVQTPVQRRAPVRAAEAFTIMG